MVLEKALTGINTAVSNDQVATRAPSIQAPYGAAIGTLTRRLWIKVPPVQNCAKFPRLTSRAMAVQSKAAAVAVSRRCSTGDRTKITFLQRKKENEASGVLFDARAALPTGFLEEYVSSGFVKRATAAIESRSRSTTAPPRSASATGSEASGKRARTTWDPNAIETVFAEQADTVEPGPYPVANADSRCPAVRNLGGAPRT